MSNAGATRPALSNPRCTFAVVLKDMEALNSLVDDLDNLDIREDDNPRHKGKKGAPEEDKEDADKDKDEEEEELLIGNNDDDKELSAEAIDDLMVVIRLRTKQKFSLMCVAAFSLLSLADDTFVARNNQTRNISLVTSRRI